MFGDDDMLADELAKEVEAATVAAQIPALLEQLVDNALHPTRVAAVRTEILSRVSQLVLERDEAQQRLDDLLGTNEAHGLSFESLVRKFEEATRVHELHVVAFGKEAASSGWQYENLEGKRKLLFVAYTQAREGSIHLVRGGDDEPARQE